MLFSILNIKYRIYTFEVCYGTILNVTRYNKPSRGKNGKIVAASSMPINFTSLTLSPIMQC